MDASDEDDAGSVRGEEAEGTAGEGTGGEGTATDVDGRAAPKRKKSRMGVLGISRRSSAVAGPETQNAEAQAQAILDEIASRRRYVDR